MISRVLILNDLPSTLGNRIYARLSFDGTMELNGSAMVNLSSAERAFLVAHEFGHSIAPEGLAIQEEEDFADAYAENVCSKLGYQSVNAANLRRKIF